MRDREETIAHEMRYCQHYDPAGRFMTGGKQPHGKCKAGIVYDEAFPDYKVPCVNGFLGKGENSQEQQRQLCPQWIQRTREMGEARYDEIDEAMSAMKKVGPVVAEWRKKPPRGKNETIKCPACGGNLQLSQSSYNGHVHGKCWTVGCVSWME